MLNDMPNGAEPVEVRLTRLETQVPHLADRIGALTVSLEKLRWALWSVTGTLAVAAIVALVNQLGA